MALPDLVFASQSLPATFIGGRAFPVQKHIDYEWGPIAISDPSKGSMYQIWRARMENNYVYLSAPNVPEFVLLDLPSVTEISFTFDQNARHIFVYVQAGVVKMHWYDTAIGDYTTTVFSGDIITPRIALDDKRDMQRGVSDIVLFYVKPIRDNRGVQVNGSLFMLTQRDRYLDEVLMATDVTGGIVKCGMMNNWRLGVQLEQYTAPTWVADVEDGTISICHFDSEDNNVAPDARLTSGWRLYGGGRILKTGGKFGGCFDGTQNGSAILLNQQATITGGEYQFEFFVKMDISPNWRFLITQFGRGDSNSSIFNIQKYNDRVVFIIYAEDGSRTIHEMGQHDFSEYTHIAVTFSGGDNKDIKVFVGGVTALDLSGVDIAKGGHVNSQIILGQPVTEIQPPASRQFIDEFRARNEITYTSDFSPPQAPFI